MAHMFESGFTVREPAWHGLATVLPDYPGREEAIRIAGQDWTLEERPIQFGLGIDAAYSSYDATPIPVEDWKALVRDDTQALVSVVRGSYTPIQNEKLWDIIEAMLGEQNVRYETAGVLRGGALVWVLARIDEPNVVLGDNSEIYPYALVSTGHDGSHPCAASAVSIRVVCWNTFQAAQAESGRSGRSFTFRHTKNVMDRIEDAKAALGLIRHQHEEFIHLANELATMPVSRDGMNDFVLRFIPEPRADVISDRVRTNIENARQQLRELIDLSPTIPDAHRRTAYGLFSAGVEYLDWTRKVNKEEVRFTRSMLDTTKTKLRLAELAAKVAA